MGVEGFFLFIKGIHILKLINVVSQVSPTTFVRVSGAISCAAPISAPARAGANA